MGVDKAKIKEIMAQMTIEEKASLLSGADFWHTKAAERFGVPAISMSDGPHGLRKQRANELGADKSYPATCFPTASLLACSWDEELAAEQGRAIGREALAMGLSCVLGPGSNIKRSPLCGRNFEYFSEDPFLSSKMAGGIINGLQGEGVSACLKHFAVNNQEDYRFWVDARVDERALREIYLASFEAAVKEAKPKAVMCSYNKVNGVYASENRWLLTEILREEWGFNGIVMSDWGAVNNRPQGVWAGLDLEMPGSFGVNDGEIVKAAKGEDVYFAPTTPAYGGRLTEAEIDLCAERMLTWIYENENRNKPVESGFAANHKTARDIASECMVLLENNGILPLKKGADIAVVGEMAVTPRYQGSGSSRVVPVSLDKPFDEISKFADAVYARGYALDDDNNLDYIGEAVKATEGKDAVVIVAGLPDNYESEGYDRKHMRLPQSHYTLIEKVYNVNPNVVVVICGGSPVKFNGNCAALLMAYLGGEAAGGAIADILFGEKNPGGKLAETFPERLEDNPSYLNFPGDGESVAYGEGLYVGYRWYEARRIEPLYPFGYGLSYTDFKYENLTLSANEISESDMLEAMVKITNTGAFDGKEIVQLYVRELSPRVERPEKELKGFQKIALKKGESGVVKFALDRRAFSYWDVGANNWVVTGGDYEIKIGASSADIRLSETVRVKPDKEIVPVITMYSEVKSLFNHPNGMGLLKEIAAFFQVDVTAENINTIDCSSFVWCLLRNLITMFGFKWTFAELQEKIDRVNGGK